MKQLVFFIILFNSTFAYSQNDKVWIKGLVKDSVNGLPIANVHVLAKNDQAVSDKTGEFRILASPGENLVFSHLAYERKTYPLPSIISETEVLLFMQPAAYVLDEFTVRSLPSEEAIKNEILNIFIYPTREEQILTNNLNYMKSIYKMAYYYDFNSYDALLKHAKNPGEISLFSFNPSVGFFRAIRMIKDGKQSGSVPLKKTGNSDYILDVNGIFRKSKQDSTRQIPDF